MRRWLFGLVLVSGCEWVADPQDFDRQEVPRFRAWTDAGHSAPESSPTSLRVMAWNVKYGACRVDFWFDFWGDRVQLSSTEVESCLAGIAQLVTAANPDVLMTEEIEVGSRRSAYVDMVRYLLEHTNLRYAAYFETWDTRYAPSEGLGRVNLGNAILSRYPIVKAERIRQVDRTDQDALTRTFYIKRAIGRAELDLADAGVVAAYVVHTEAYDLDGTKQKQIAQIRELLQAEALPWVIGGDFNELPPVCDERADAGSADSCDGQLELTGFPDERASSRGTAYAQPPYTPSVMKPFFEDFVPFVPLERYERDGGMPEALFTHSVLGPDGVNDEQVPGGWNRTLDYLFASPGRTWSEGLVLQEAALRLSDHAPVAGVLELR